MRTIAALFRRQPDAPDQQEAIRLLQAERCRDREHIVRLESMLRVEADRAARAQQALDEFRRDLRSGHAAVVADNARLRREVTQLRRSLDDALYDEKTLAAINAGPSKAAA